MKSERSPFSGRRRKPAWRHSARGIALVLVLAILLLITGFVLAFYASVSSELVSAKSYAGGSSGKQLAEAATQLAIGTIRKATSQTSQSYGLPNGNLSGTDIAWASQPGMIRTWDSDGNALSCYKLFSSDSLEVNVKANGPYNATSDTATDFDTKPALFTDLNAPITLPQDPNAVADPLDLSDPYHTMHYPIIDPSTSGSPDGSRIPKVQGFVIDPTAATTPATYSATKGLAPMPVRWIYVLQDGTLTTPTAGQTTATFPTTGTTAPTAANPIVGRLAYWTDDETCKVNVNTASEGVYWDMPHIVSQEDLGVWNGRSTTPTKPGLSICQPASKEFQRYAGHPATTSLSPVLGGLIPALAAPDSSTAISSGVANTFYKPYYDLIPRVTWGGSYAGTIIPNTSLTSDLGYITTDSDRLFASVDEFIFRTPTHSPGTLDLPRQVNSELASDPVGVATVKAGLERARFFLTAHSSAPEVTMFNTPRVSMWPVWAKGTKALTVLDSTLAFCANLKVGPTNNSPYYFTRSNSRSMTEDYQDQNNVRLYAYLQKLMSTSVPGYGGKFSDGGAFGADNAQVLTNIYDYIRCINMYDKTTGATSYTGSVKIGGGTWGGGEVLPIKITSSGGTTQGFGRFGTLSGMDLIFCGVAAPPPATPNPSLPDTSKVTARVQVMMVPTFFSPMQGLPGMFPHVSYTITLKPDPSTGTIGFKLNGRPIFKTDANGSAGTNWIANIPAQQNVGRGLGSMLSPRVSLGSYGPFNGTFTKPFSPGASIPPANPPTPTSSGSYPFVSYYVDPVKGTASANIPLVVPPPATPATSAPATMDFVGGPLEVKLYSGEGELLQTFEMIIPNAAGSGAALPVPKVPPVNPGPLVGNTTNPFAPARSDTSVSAFDDVTRGVEVAGLGDNPNETTAGTNTTAGDVRMIATRSTVPNTYYHAHQNWATANFMASGMEDDDGSNSYILPDTHAGSGLSGRGSHGALAAGMHPRNGDFDGAPTNPSYGYKGPYVPSRTYSSAQTGVTRSNNSATTPGDWDTGYAMLPDGAHINMGDIGDGAYIDEVLYPSSYRGLPRYPYVVKEDHFNSDRGAGSYFSPSRQVPSSMVLGSIPTGVQRFQPWQTLLFNPKPEDPGHPGRRVPSDYTQPGTVPPDHLIADFFWMPVVEPYPISQPFSTAGKINMNYQIEPFNYIKRATGIYAVMKSTKMMAIPASTYHYAPNSYDPKPLISNVNPDVNNAYGSGVPNARLGIDMDETVKGFDDKFATNDIFRSASQISEINLVPKVQTGAQPTHQTDSMATFWKANTLSGDNLREKPYVDIYPRLTTKSNSYTVHFRVQVLQKSPSTSAGQWVEGRDQIVSEYRGSSEVERYLDSAKNLPDFATLMAGDPTNQGLNLDKFYQYRIVSTKRFSPY